MSNVHDDEVGLDEDDEAAAMAEAEAEFQHLAIGPRTKRGPMGSSNNQKTQAGDPTRPSAQEEYA